VKFINQIPSSKFSRTDCHLKKQENIMAEPQLRNHYSFSSIIDFKKAPILLVKAAVNLLNIFKKIIFKYFI